MASLTITRIYNPNLAWTLEKLLNYPNECTCENCQYYKFSLTGYLIDDGIGMFVEKKCLKCGTVTEEGDGDFHEFFCIVDGEVIYTDGGEICPPK